MVRAPGELISRGLFSTTPCFRAPRRDLVLLARRQQETRDAHERLALLKHETSAGVSVAHRARIFVGTAAAVAVIGAWGWLLRDHISFWSPVGLLAMMLGVLAVLSSGLFVCRRELFKTRLNKAISLTLLAWAVALAVNRALGLLHDLPVPSVLSTDMVLSALAASVCGITVRRPYLWCGVAFGLGAVLSSLALVPAPLAWFGSMGLAFSIAAVAEIRRDRKDASSCSPTGAEPESVPVRPPLATPGR